jgi:hypothetical protein
VHDHLPYRVLPPSLLASFISPPPSPPVFSCPCVPYALVCPCSVCPPPPSAARKPLMRVWHRRVQGGVDPKSGVGCVCEGSVWSGARMGTVDGAVQVGVQGAPPHLLLPSFLLTTPSMSPRHLHPPLSVTLLACLQPLRRSFLTTNVFLAFLRHRIHSPCFPCATALAGSPILRVAHHYHL